LSGFCRLNQRLAGRRCHAKVRPASGFVEVIMQVALVGPPLSGKTSLFQAVTGVAPDPSKYHGATPQPGRVEVPDPRLSVLSDHYQPKKTTPAMLDVLDFAGIEPGSRTENVKRILGSVRDADALVVVLPAYDDVAAVTKAWEDMHGEFLFGDLEVIEKRIGRLEQNLKRPMKNKEDDQRELELLNSIREHLENTETWAGIELDERQEKTIRGYAFLLQKPLIPVINANEPGDVDPASLLPADAAARALVLNAEVERDVAELPEAEQGEFLAEFGITEPAAPRVVRAAYDALGAMSFFTVGEDECRAWTIQRGDDAVTAAGKIHTDLARGFIRAEVFTYDDFVEHGDEKSVKAAGKHRLEGKDYTVQDGDILNIRFSV
jgi:GTP-binding protein YchF